MKKKGFLLFEVMVSILIVTTVLLVIVKAYGTSQRALKVSDSIVRVMPQFDELLLPSNDTGKISAGDTSGDCRPPYDSYAWDIKSGPASTADLNNVTVTITNKRDPEIETFSLTTFYRTQDNAQAQ